MDVMTRNNVQWRYSIALALAVLVALALNPHSAGADGVGIFGTPWAGS